jgi:hypothetical protein
MSRSNLGQCQESFSISDGTIHSKLIGEGSWAELGILFARIVHEFEQIRAVARSMDADVSFDMFLEAERTKLSELEFDNLEMGDIIFLMTILSCEVVFLCSTALIRRRSQANSRNHFLKFLHLEAGQPAFPIHGPCHMRMSPFAENESDMMVISNFDFEDSSATKSLNSKVATST